MLQVLQLVDFIRKRNDVGSIDLRLVHYRHTLAQALHARLHRVARDLERLLELLGEA